MCAKVIHSLVHPFTHTRVRLAADRDHLFSWVSEQLFVVHPSAIAVFTPAQKIRTKGGSELVFDSIEPNKTGANTPLMYNPFFFLDTAIRQYVLYYRDSMMIIKPESVKITKIPFTKYLRNWFKCRFLYTTGSKGIYALSISNIVGTQTYFMQLFW